MRTLALIRFEWVILLFKFKPKYLSENKIREIKRYLRDQNCLIATYDPYSLSGMFVIVGTYIKTRRWPKYTHLIANTERAQTSLSLPIEFKFVEATGKGVKKPTFDQVFRKVKRAALLTPKFCTQDQFEEAIYFANDTVGREYDFLYNNGDQTKMSCVEVILYCLRKLPNYEVNFRCLDFMMKYLKVLTPQMFIDCGEFHVYEVEAA